MEINNGGSDFSYDDSYDLSLVNKDNPATTDPTDPTDPTTPQPLIPLPKFPPLSDHTSPTNPPGGRWSVQPPGADPLTGQLYPPSDATHIYQGDGRGNWTMIERPITGVPIPNDAQVGDIYDAGGTLLSGPDLVWSQTFRPPTGSLSVQPLGIDPQTGKPYEKSNPSSFGGIGGDLPVGGNIWRYDGSNWQIVPAPPQWGGFPPSSIIDAKPGEVFDDSGKTLYSPSSGKPYSDTSPFSNLYQHSIGDCWWVASVESLAKNDPSLLNSIVKLMPGPNGSDGGYSIVFPGDTAQQTYTVTPEELSAYWQSQGLTPVTGDQRAAALEIAANKYFTTHGMPQGISAGGNPSLAIQLLTGGNTNYAGCSTGGGADVATLFNEFKNGSSIGVASSLNPPPSSTIVSNHAYTILSVDSNAKTVTLINPWDTSKPITLSYDDFMKNFSCVEVKT